MEHPVNGDLPRGVITNGVDQLAETNPFEPGRISPHTHYKADNFRVTELAFDDQVVLSQHSSPHPVIIQVASGSVELEIGGTVHRLAAGAMMHLEASLEHSVTALEQARLLLIFLYH